MSWISKSLTLDILAITIDGLNKVFDRIKAEPETFHDLVSDPSPWPTEQPAPAMQQPTPATAPVNIELPADSTVPAPVVQQAVQAAEQTLAQKHASVAQQPAAPTEDLRPQAQDALRRIAQAEGTDWIRETLFPHFGTTTLNDIPAEKLQEVIAMSTTRLELGATTA